MGGLECAGETWRIVRMELFRHLQKEDLISEFPTLEEQMLIDSCAWFIWLRENKPVDRQP